MCIRDRTSAATLVAACGQLFFIRQNGYDYFDVFAAQAVIMWGFAALLFGTGLATLRFRAWMPLFIGILVCSSFLALYLALAVEALAKRSGSKPTAYISFGVFSLSCVAIGLVLAWATYRRWLTADLT